MVGFIKNYWLPALALLLSVAATEGLAVALEQAFHEDVRWSLPALPRQIDNRDWRSLDRWYIITNVFETLITYDVKQNITAGVASGWLVSSDRLTYTFELRPNARFSSGRTIVSDDVVFSLKRYLISQKKASIFKKAVRGAEGLAVISQNIPGIQAPDSRHVILTLSKPLENIWSFLAQPQIGGIVAKESVNEQDLSMKPEAVASGPFFVAAHADNHIVLRRNEYYHTPNPIGPRTVGLYQYDDIEQSVRWFEEGKTNLYSILEPFQQVGRDLLLSRKYISYPFHRVGLVYLNCHSDTFRDRAVRYRIAHALSLKQMKAFNNQMLIWNNSFFPPGSPGYVEDDYQENDPSVGDRHGQMQVLIESGAAEVELKQLIRRQLESVGYDVEFVGLTKREISSRLSQQKFDAAVLSLGLPMADHGLGAYVYFVESPKYLMDLTGRVEHAALKYTQVSDAIEKGEVLRSIAQQIHEDACVIPIYHTAVRYVMADELSVDETERYRVDIQLNTISVPQKRVKQ